MSVAGSNPDLLSEYASELLTTHEQQPIVRQKNLVSQQYIAAAQGGFSHLWVQAHTSIQTLSARELRTPSICRLFVFKAASEKKKVISMYMCGLFVQPFTCVFEMESIAQMIGNETRGTRILGNKISKVFGIKILADSPGLVDTAMSTIIANANLNLHSLYTAIM